uniref:G-protein coupled receptors family 1 profile domain-containing protein n=1 Tax=Anas platyrhynchos TaxID=8839 RepID=A0A8B9ZKP6_ANAPL
GGGSARPRAGTGPAAPPPANGPARAPAATCTAPAPPPAPGTGTGPRPPGHHRRSPSPSPIPGAAPAPGVIAPREPGAGHHPPCPVPPGVPVSRRSIPAVCPPPHLRHAPGNPGNGPALAAVTGQQPRPAPAPPWKAAAPRPRRAPPGPGAASTPRPRGAPGTTGSPRQPEQPPEPSPRCWVSPKKESVHSIQGGIGNLFVIVLLAKRSGGRRAVDTFVLNLAVADVVFVCTLPFWVAAGARGNRWLLGEGLCKASSYAISVNRCSSILFLTGAQCGALPGHLEGAGHQAGGLQEARPARLRADLGRLPPAGRAGALVPAAGRGRLLGRGRGGFQPGHGLPHLPPTPGGHLVLLLLHLLPPAAARAAGPGRAALPPCHHRHRRGLHLLLAAPQHLQGAPLPPGQGDAGAAGGAGGDPALGGGHQHLPGLRQQLRQPRHLRPDGPAPPLPTHPWCQDPPLHHRLQPLARQRDQAPRGPQPPAGHVRGDGDTNAVGLGGGCCRYRARGVLGCFGKAVAEVCPLLGEAPVPQQWFQPPRALRSPAPKGSRGAAPGRAVPSWFLHRPGVGRKLQLGPCGQRARSHRGGTAAQTPPGLELNGTARVAPRVASGLAENEYSCRRTHSGVGCVLFHSLPGE